MKRDLRIEYTYQHPIELVWQALTDKDTLSEWLMENDFAPVVGHEFEFQTEPAPGFDGVVHCRVLKVEKPRQLSYSWRGGSHDTVVTFTLETVENGTRLTLEHTGFKGVGGVLTSVLLGLGWKWKILRKHLPATLQHLSA